MEEYTCRPAGCLTAGTKSSILCRKEYSEGWIDKRRHAEHSQLGLHSSIDFISF